MKNKIIHVILFAILGLFLLGSPLLVSEFLSKPAISEYVNNTLKINNESLAEMILEYISLSVSFILAIFVFAQSERINRLQTMQYDNYFIINDLDYSFSYENTFSTNNKSKKDLTVSHTFFNEKKAIVTSMNVGKGTGYPLFLPLNVLTRNQQLITSISIMEVSAVLMGKSKKIYKKSAKSDGERINFALENNTHFLLGIGMIVPEAMIEDIHLRVILRADNQWHQMQRFCASIQLIHDRETRYVITSSELKVL